MKYAAQWGCSIEGSGCTPMACIRFSGISIQIELRIRVDCFCSQVKLIVFPSTACLRAMI